MSAHPDLLQNREVVDPLEQAIVREQFPQQHPRGKYVRAVVRRQTENLLGGEVRDLSF